MELEYVEKAAIFIEVPASIMSYIAQLFFFFPFRDKLFPAFGFGARLPPNWQISHEFPLVIISFLLFISTVILVLWTLQCKILGRA